MNALSEIFLVTFSILYGIMLNACLGLGLFPFGRLHKFGMARKKAITRIVCSFLIINILPFVLFSWVFVRLEEMQPTLCGPPDMCSIISIFIMSMVVFGFHRFYQFLIAWHLKWFYDLKKERLPESRKENILFVANSSWKGHLVGVLLYFGFFGIFARYLGVIP